MRTLMSSCLVFIIIALPGCASVPTTIEASNTIVPASKADTRLFGTYTKPELSGLSEQSRYPTPNDGCVLLNSNELVKPFQLENHFLIACAKHETGAIQDRIREDMVLRIENPSIAVQPAPSNAVQPIPYLGQDTEDTYSKFPLSNPLLDFDQATDELGNYHQWLRENFATIPSNQYKVFRERLYYLLSSYVSGINKRDDTIMPRASDKNLYETFQWAEKLGVYGGAHVHESFKQVDTPSIKTINKIPGNFRLSVEGDRIQLASKKDIWSVKFPYYFMIQNLGTIGQYKNVAGDTHAVAISTGAARDNSKAGVSQATIIVFYASKLDSEKLSTDVLKQIGIPKNSKLFDLGIESRNSQYVYDVASNIHKEATFWETDTGAYGIGYLGVDGTYQTNRLHFLEFLKQFQYQ